MIKTSVNADVIDAVMMDDVLICVIIIVIFANEYICVGRGICVCVPIFLFIHVYAMHTSHVINIFIFRKVWSRICLPHLPSTTILISPTICITRPIIL